MKIHSPVSRYIEGKDTSLFKVDKQQFHVNEEFDLVLGEESPFLEHLDFPLIVFLPLNQRSAK